MPPQAAALTSSSIVELLAAALGREQSEDLVSKAAARLGLTSSKLQLEEALSIVDALSEEPGIVGVSARFARARLVHRNLTHETRKSSNRSLRRVSGSPNGGGGRAERAAQAPAWSMTDVVFLLTASLGKERAAEVAEEAARQLQLRPPFDETGVSRLLDHLAERGDVVGVVARFAKSRLVLPKAQAGSR
jgi:hypothetical protein